MRGTKSSILSIVHIYHRPGSFKVLYLLACLTLSLIPGPFLTQDIVQAEELSSPQMMGDSLDIQIISAGGRHSCGIKPNNSIECWGDNDQEQLNVPVPNASFQQVSAGGEHSCGLKTDGSIVCWGENASGQSLVPAPNTNFIQVSAGADHSCGLKNDGSLVCWGANANGQGTVPAPNSNWDQVSAGLDHSCGLKIDGSLVCWGDNGAGESTVPSPNQDWAQISAGRNFSCGLKKDGSLSCWGANGFGQSTVPSPNSDYSLVSTGNDHACARKTDSSLVCWGRNNQGQRDIPAPNVNYGQVSAGATHSCGLKYDGSFSCWGNDIYGQADPNYFTHVSAGAAHTCALTKGDSAKCWGGYMNNFNGEGTVRFPNNDYYDISAGFISTCGLKNDGTLHCWPGDIAAIPAPNANWFRVSAGWGVCAMRNTDFSMTCWGVFSIPTGTVPGPFNFFSDYPISAGVNHTCAVHAAAGNPVECWTAPPSPPIGLPTPNSGFWDVSVGYDFACGRRTGDQILCWGDNSFGQTSVPAPNSNWRSVSAGARYACGTKNTGPGNIICWGDNTYGQSSVPAPNADFRVIDAGTSHTCGIKNDGRLLCWGYNDDGQTDVPHLDTLKSPPANLFPPFAVDDSFTTQEDSPLAVDSASGVLANDHDLDGFPITAHKDSDPSLGTVSLAADGSFTYTPTADLCGPDSFTYHAEDSSNSSNIATVNLTVNCENDPPTYSDPGLATYYEDDAVVQIDLWPDFSDLEDTDLQLGFALETNSNPALFTPVSISTDRYLELALAGDGNGTGTITIRVTDTGSLFVDGALDFEVLSVNDAPSFTPGGDITVPMNSGAYSASWASNISPGPSNESSQTLTFSVNNDNNGLFSAQPTLSVGGLLDFTPTAGSVGSTQVSVALSDDGGTLRGGMDTSPTETFTITVAPFPTVTQVQPENGPGITPGSTVIDRINDIRIHFDLTLDNPPGNSDPDDVTNPANYLLVEAGLNAFLETSTCQGGVGGDDVNIPIDWISYPVSGNVARVFINGGAPLPSGNYRLLVCGSTSITSGGIALAGDGSNSGTDYSLNFSILLPARLPETGFPPDIVTRPITESPPELPNSAAGLKLEIPRLDISLPITSVPYQESDWDISWLTHQVGWLEGTAFPTWSGNSVITGHVVNANGLPGPFANIHQLRFGDQIIIQGWGQQYIYTVQSVQTLDPWNTAPVYKHESYPWVTLLTCSNYYSPLEVYSSRIVIKAVQVDIR